MTYLDDLKEKINKHERKDFFRSIHDNPDYDAVLGKLKDLAGVRERIRAELLKIELDIDACLVLIEMKRQKDEIDKKD